MLRHRWRLLVFGLVVGTFLASSLVMGQFFTKSSKSIPRMGRRSDQTLARTSSLDQAVLDQYLPELLQADSRSEAGKLDRINGELVLQYEQPIQESDFQSGGVHSRNERSQMDPARASLALRAAYLDRLIQRLSSGQMADRRESMLAAASNRPMSMQQRQSDRSSSDRFAMVD